MRALVQRVHWAEVDVDGRIAGRIRHGLLVYVGVAVSDTPADAERLAEKVTHLRIFPDEAGKLNLSVQDARGGVLVVSNFTLMAETSKGRRPAFTDAAAPEAAEPLQDKVLAVLEDMGCSVARGVFGATMTVRSAADGPVNVLVDLPPA
ncbi:MAG: D-aminoacyl-tRNA deacylase [Planctomycetota bacterium]|nr:D-aminoacyl-tRNA deacylase [Planctomycetota bacterium]